MRRCGTTKVVPFRSPVVAVPRIAEAAESLKCETVRYPLWPASPDRTHRKRRPSADGYAPPAIQWLDQSVPQ